MTRKLILALLLSAFALSAQTNYPSALDNTFNLTDLADRAQTTLTGSMTSSSTSFTVVSASKFTAGMVLTIENEQIKVWSVVGNTVNVGNSGLNNVDGRGFAGTAAASHANLLLVSDYVVAWQFKALRSALIGIETTLGVNMINTTPPNPTQVDHGGTGAQTAAAARASLSAAALGANNDITALNGLSTPLPLSEGGSGATTAAGARASFQSAALGSNNDITALTGLLTPLPLSEGGTAATTAAAARASLGSASVGANSDITSLTALTTPLAVAEGGSGVVAAQGAGTGTKVQLALGAFTPGNVAKYDSTGALIDSGFTPAAIPAGPVDTKAYNWSQTPTGTISAGGNTVTLTPCPVGLNGADSNHWIAVSGPSAAATVAVASATNPLVGTTIAVTTAANHGLASGNFVTLSGMANPGANGPWQIAVTGVNSFSLLNSTMGLEIASATNATPIVVTTYLPVTADHGFQTGDSVTMAGFTSNTAANGTWVITRLSPTSFSLNGSAGNGFTAGNITISGTYTSSAGVVTYGPEAALLTGGSCTSGAASGTVIFTAANAHSAGYAISSATAGASEAVNVAVAGGLHAVHIPAGTNTWQAGVTLPSGFELVGELKQSVIALAAGFPTLNLIAAKGAAAGASTTSTTSLPVSTRATVVTDNINVASAAAFAAGDWVNMTTTEATYGNVFSQMLQVKSIAGNNLTFKGVVLIPLDTAQTGNVVKVTPVSQITIRDLTLDGSGTGSGQYIAGAVIMGLNLQIAVDSRIQGVTFRNWARDAGMYAVTGSGNKFRDLAAAASGSLGFNDLSFYGQTSPQIADIDSIDATGFGPGLYQTVGAQVANLHVDRPTARGFKLSGLGWSTLTNISTNGSRAGNGLAVTQGSWRNVISNVITNFNAAVEGVWFSSQDNQFNILNGVQAIGNAVHGLIFYQNDHDNVARNVYTNTALADLGTNNTIGTAVTYRSSAVGGQTIPSTGWWALNLTSSNYDVGGIHSTSINNTRFTIPVGEAGGVGAPQSGTYLLSGEGSFTANATGQRGTGWWKNGVQLACFQTVPANTGAGAITRVQGGCQVMLVPGDYVELMLLQDTGGGLVVSGTGSILRLF